MIRLFPRGIVVLGGGISYGEEQTLTLQPDAAAGIDTWIQQNAATNNNGVNTTLVSGLGAVGGSLRRALIKFDLSALPSSALILSAVMTLYCENEPDATNYTIGAHRALTAFFEGAKNGAAPSALQDGSTWNLRNANGSVAWAGGAGGAAGSDWATVATASTSITGPTTTFTWDLLADVSPWVRGSVANHGLWLINTSEAIINSFKVFTSSDGTTAANRPKLVVGYKLPL